MKNRYIKKGISLLSTSIIIITFIILLFILIIIFITEKNKPFEELTCSELSYLDSYCNAKEFWIFCFPSWKSWKDKTDILERRMELGCFEDENI